ncbi:MAG: hypothetical protein ACJ72L_06390 [Marmoricola sp.]
MKGIKRRAIAVLGLSVASALIGVGVANADPVIPVGGHTYDRPLQGEGSDTTEGVMNGLSEVVTSGGNKVISSYNALGSTGFQTRASGCTYTGNPASGYVEGQRANGSGPGVNALNDAFVTPTKATNGCLDFARASSVQGAQTVGMTYVPFAKDAVAFAVTNSSNIPRSLSIADLTAMYRCTYPGFTGATPTRHALLPQAGSGTRKFWLSKIGVTEQNITDDRAAGKNCVSDQKDRTSLGGSNFIEEHQGNVLDDNSVVPISIAQYIAQSQGSLADVRGRAILGTVVDQNSSGSTPATQFSLPMSMNASYGNVTGGVTMSRDVYNVIPTQTVGNGSYALLNQTFVGNSSLVCQNSATILKYGFGTVANCGDTSTTTAGQ